MTKLMFGIENEYEGDSTMWFDLENPQVIADYIKSNIDRDEKKTFIVSMVDENDLAKD